jgi:hypothetical protein
MGMRTTLSLDDDVAALLRRALKRRGATLKGVVNEALRHGLPALERPPAARKPYRIEPWHGGIPRVPNLDDIGEILAAVEGEDHR